MSGRRRIIKVLEGAYLLLKCVKQRRRIWANVWIRIQRTIS